MKGVDKKQAMLYNYYKYKELLKKLYKLRGDK